MKTKNYFILVLFLQSWIFFSVLLTTPIQSLDSTHQETNLSVKTSSNEAFPRLLNETQVNYNTTDNQQNPSICALSSDTFAVAWQSNGQDGSFEGVYASVFDASTGNNITREFRVNDYTEFHQRYPSICALSSDTFAVAWSGFGQGDSSGVYASVFDAKTGNNITSEFQVNDYTENHQGSPSICALSSDTFAVAWESEGQDSDGWEVYARVFDATTGNNITSEFRVNHYTPSDQQNPSICALSSDTFAVAWTSWEQDDSGYGVYARVFDAKTGNNITREFRINDFIIDNQMYPSLCALSSDTFAVAWQSSWQEGEMAYGVYTRVFNASTGNNITSEFRVNDYTPNSQMYPSICALSSDTFAVAWSGEGQGDSSGVYARVFNASTGKNITREFQVNNYTLTTQEMPSICALSSDTFAVAWTSWGQDVDGAGVYVSVFGNPSSSLPSVAGDDDDDDDDNGEELNMFVLSLIIIGIVLVVGITGIIIYLIKKKGR